MCSGLFHSHVLSFGTATCAPHFMGCSFYPEASCFAFATPIPAIGREYLQDLDVYDAQGALCLLSQSVPGAVRQGILNGLTRLSLSLWLTHLHQDRFGLISGVAYLAVLPRSDLRDLLQRLLCISRLWPPCVEGYGDELVHPMEPSTGILNLSGRSPPLGRRICPASGLRDFRGGCRVCTTSRVKRGSVRLKPSFASRGMPPSP